MNKLVIGLLLIVLTFSFISCVEKSKTENRVKIEEQEINGDFDWLLGDWKRNNEKEGEETFEVWKKNSNSEYSGLGFTLQNGDTIKQEKIWLLKSSNQWVLSVQTPDESTPILFNVTSYNEHEFVCENKELDFPKLIKYWKDGNTINALVSGDDLEILFEFEKFVESNSVVDN